MTAMKLALSSAVFLILLQIFVPYAHALHYRQYYQVFSYDGCVGLNQVYFLDTNTTLAANGGLPGAKSASVRGLWKMKAGSVTDIRLYSHSTKTCYMPVHYSETAKLESVTRVVPGDMDDSVLSLYPLQDYEGERVVVTASGLQLPQDITVRSWAFTGPEGFTLFEGDNFQGNSTCLAPDTQTETLGWGLRSAQNANSIKVRSVRLGCSTKATRTSHGDFGEITHSIHGDFANLTRIERAVDVKWY